MLSQENINKLCMTGLYRHEPDITKVYAQKHSNLYHCKNWTFKVYKHNDVYYMKDTYWGDSSDFKYELSDDNFEEFEFIFDVMQVKLTDYPEEYNEEDVYYRIPTDSCGIQFAKSYIKRGAKRSKEKLIAICKQEIESYENQLERLKKELKELEDGTYYKLK